MVAQPTWLEWAGAQQDFGWFLALLGWSGALIGWWHHPRRADFTPWLPATGGLALAAAAVEFLRYTLPFDWFYERLVPGTLAQYVPAKLPADVFTPLALDTAAALAAAAWWLAAPPRVRRWAPAVIASAAFAHVVWPDAGRWFLAGLAVAAAGGSPHPPAAGRAERLARALAAWVPLAIVARTLGAGPAASPYWEPPALAGLGPLALLLSTGATAAVALRLPSEARTPGRRGAFLPLFVAWMAAGLAFAVKSGRDQRREILEHRLRTVAALAGPFATHVPRPLRKPADRAGDSAPELSADEALALARALRRVTDTAIFAASSQFLVLRADGLLEFGGGPVRTAGPAYRRRAATDEDRRHWTLADNYVVSSSVPRPGDRYYCRAAVRDSAGAMLGWLEVTRSEYHLSLERNGRATPLAVTGVVAVLLVALWLDGRMSRMRERRAAVEAETRRARADFLAQVSHELRTPLQNILGYGELLAASPPTPTAAGPLAALRENSAQMLRLVDDLLDLAALESGTFRFVERPVDVPALVRETLAAATPRAVTLTVHGPADAAWCHGDARALRRIAQLLAATGAGSPSAVATLRGERDAAGRIVWELAIATPATTEAEGVRVADFHRVASVGDAAPGPDQRLALTRALCVAAGGGLEYAPGPGGAGTLRARWRLRAAAEPTRRVLIVESNPLVRELLSGVLAGGAVACETAGDATSATERVLAGGPWTAIVLESRMPGLEIATLVQRLRAQSAAPPPRIVVVDERSDSPEGAVPGVDARLARPVDLAAFRAAVGLADAGAEH